MVDSEVCGSVMLEAVAALSRFRISAEASALPSCTVDVSCFGAFVNLSVVVELLEDTILRPSCTVDVSCFGAFVNLSVTVELLEDTILPEIPLW